MPTLSYHSTCPPPYHVISKIRVRKHNTGPITVLTLIIFHLPQFLYDRRYQKFESYRQERLWLLMAGIEPWFLFGRIFCISVAIQTKLSRLSVAGWRCRYCVTLRHLLRLFTVDRYDVCLSDNSSVHVSSFQLLYCERFVRNGYLSFYVQTGAKVTWHSMYNNSKAVRTATLREGTEDLDHVSL